MSNFIIIYGPVAVGKLTTAKLLSEKLGYKMSHNHAINDVVSDLFDIKSKEYDEVVHNMRVFFFQQVLNHDINLITTHCYAHNFVNKVTGMTDPEYIKELVNIGKSNGKNVCVVHLKASNAELMKRVVEESRKAHKKLTDEQIMKEISEQNDWENSAPIEGQMILDNTNLSVEESVNEIIKYFDLK
ncbi:AAA family ATPase [Candidatus Nomurabacteria bacterium]|nr:AAA family ATPase [Candidatus Nomurabacteria bacterium]MCB9820531.1 AAA family ATPase [Candidatus Nomurabacteria bacterium]